VRTRRAGGHRRDVERPYKNERAAVRARRTTGTQVTPQKRREY